MGVKRFDYILGTGPEEGWIEEAAHGQYVKSADYDALAAQLAELRAHLGTLTPGGSHTCITCAVHCVALEDAAARIAALAAALAKFQNGTTYVVLRARIAQLEAALNGVEGKLAEYLERLLQGRTLPNRWVGEINDIVQAAKTIALETQTTNSVSVGSKSASEAENGPKHE